MTQSLTDCNCISCFDDLVGQWQYLNGNRNLRDLAELLGLKLSTLRYYRYRGNNGLVPVITMMELKTLIS